MLWMVLEVVVLLLPLYLHCALGAKYLVSAGLQQLYRCVRMSLGVATWLLLGSNGYCIYLAWIQSAVMYFIVCSL